jgi:type II secretory pathway pseudopilin PulG
VNLTFVNRELGGWNQSGRRRRRRHQAGAVLLEVVLALVLLAAAATIIGTGLGSSIDAVERQRLNIHAANLAASVLAEFQLGLRTVGNGPEPFAAPFDHWSWELRAAPVESELSSSPALTLTEVIVRHDDPPVTHRLAQIVRVSAPPQDRP